MELIGTRDAREAVFLNRCGRPITRIGIHGLVWDANLFDTQLVTARSDGTKTQLMARNPD